MSETLMTELESSFALDLNVKAFKGKGDFRSLMRDQIKIANSVHIEMAALEEEVSKFDLPMLLILTVDDKTSPYVKRARLRWRLRGQGSHASFNDIVRPLFAHVPATLHGYLDRCNERAQELNALEAVFRYAACQVGSFLEHGSVKISNRAGAEANVPQAA